MNKRSWILGLSLALVATFGIAQGPRGKSGFEGPRADRGHRMGMAPGAGLVSPLMARALDIDDAQKTAIRERMKAAAEEAKPIREKQAALRKSIEDAVKNNAGDATLSQLAAESGALSGELQAVMLKARSSVYNEILTSAQRAKIDELRQDFRKRHQRGGPRGKRPAPQAAPQG
jgi:Spy/CpxP family protein refolding chaperone